MHVESVDNIIMSLAHLSLSATSAWALKKILKENTWAYGTYSFLGAYGIIGALQSCEGHIFDSIVLKNASLVAEILPLPCIMAELYKSKNCIDLADIHYVTALIPLAMKFFANQENPDIINMIITGNIISLVHFSATYNNGWGLTLAISQFIFRQLISKSYEPKLDLFAIGMCFFNILSYRALQLSKRQKDMMNTVRKN